MSKVLLSLLLGLLIMSGVIFWFLDSFATTSQTNITVTPDVGQSFRVTWMNPQKEYKQIILETTQQGVVEIVSVVNNPIEGGKENVYITPHYFNVEIGLTVKGITNSGKEEMFSHLDFTPRTYSKLLVIASRIKGVDSSISVYTTQGVKVSEFTPFPKYQGSLDVIRIDSNKDSVPELVVGASSIAKLLVTSIDGNVQKEIAPYGLGYEMGYFMHALNLDSDGFVESFVVGPRWGSDSKLTGTHPVKVLSYNQDKQDFVITDEFIGYENFEGGVQVFAGDVSGDGIDEIITSPLGGKAELRIHTLCQSALNECEKFYGTQRFSKPWSVYDKTYPYGILDKSAMSVLVNDVTGDARDEIIILPKVGRSSLVKIYSCDIKEQYRCLLRLVSQKQIYGKSFQGGVEAISLSDQVLVVSPQSNGGPHVKQFTQNSGFNLMHEKFVYAPTYNGGVSISALYDTQKSEDLIATSPLNGGSHIRLFSGKTLDLVHEFFIKDKSLRGEFKLY